MIFPDITFLSFLYMMVECMCQPVQAMRYQTDGRTVFPDVPVLSRTDYYEIWWKE